MKRIKLIVIILVLMNVSCATLKDIKPKINEVYIILDVDSIDIYVNKNDIMRLVNKGFYKNRPDLDSVFLEIKELKQNVRVYEPIIGKPFRGGRNEFLIMDAVTTGLESKYLQNKIYVFRKDTKSWEEYYVKYMYTPFGGESVNWYFKNNGKEFYYIILSVA